MRKSPIQREGVDCWFSKMTTDPEQGRVHGALRILGSNE